MLGDLFSKLDANDSTDTLTLVFHFLYTRQSNDKVVTGFSAHVTAESGGDIYIYIYGGPRCAPGCQFTNFHEKFKMKLNVNLDNLLLLKRFNLTLE